MSSQLSPAFSSEAISTLCALVPSATPMRLPLRSAMVAIAELAGTRMPCPLVIGDPAI
jgi:hypothetical protein